MHRKNNYGYNINITLGGRYNGESSDHVCVSSNSFYISANKIHNKGIDTNSSNNL